MIDDLSTLRLLHERAEAQRDEAIVEQLKLETARRAAVAQAEQLADYRREYEQRWHAQFCRSGQIELVQCYQGFMGRLSQAVEQQQRLAEHAAAQVLRAGAIAHGHEVRAAALSRLLERRGRDHDRIAERLEQQQADEHAARLHAARWRNTGPAFSAGLA